MGNIIIFNIEVGGNLLEIERGFITMVMTIIKGL
jgi:hypothetical protein